MVRRAQRGANSRQAREIVEQADGQGENKQAARIKVMPSKKRIPTKAKATNLRAGRRK
jgi:hypothetical protein